MACHPWLKVQLGATFPASCFLLCPTNSDASFQSKISQARTFHLRSATYEHLSQTFAILPHPVHPSTNQECKSASTQVPLLQNLHWTIRSQKWTSLASLCGMLSSLIVSRFCIPASWSIDHLRGHNLIDGSWRNKRLQSGSVNWWIQNCWPALGPSCIGAADSPQFRVCVNQYWSCCIFIQINP